MSENTRMNISQALDELVMGPVPSLPSSQQFSFDISYNIIPSAPPQIEGNTTPDVLNPMALTVDIPGVELIASEEEEVSMPPPLAVISAAGEIESDTDSDTDSEDSDDDNTTTTEVEHTLYAPMSQVSWPLNLPDFSSRTEGRVANIINNTDTSGSADTRDTSTPIPLEERECTICYNNFGIDKIVNTRCGHTYCNDCFFRWLKGNVTCAMCRKNFTSWRRHSRDQLNDDITAVTYMFNSSLREHIHLTRTNSTLLTNNTKLLCEKDELMKSLIRSRELIDFNRGYAKGLLSTFRPKYTGNSREYDRGLMKGYEEFKDTIKKDRKKKREANGGYIKQPNGKTRKRESLFVFHGTD